MRPGCRVNRFAIFPLLGLAHLALPARADQVSGVVRLLGTPNPVVVGQNFTVTGGVNLSVATSATGAITITDTVTCPGAASATVVTVGMITLGSMTSATPGAGTLVVSSSSLPCAGANSTVLHSLVGSYPGDSTYSAGMSQPLQEAVIPVFTPTMTNLSSSPNPSTPGQTVTFNARLQYTQAYNAFPTGAVVFTDTNTGMVLGTARVQSSGVSGLFTTSAAITTSSLAAGSYAVQAAYSGDNIYSPSASQIVNQVVGPGVPPTPTISTVVTTQGLELSHNTNTAQNTWIEIHGSNLGQITQDWSNQDFSKGLPMSLGGVSAMVNNKPAAISYISPTQVNILTPLDSSVGPVPVQLTTPSGTTNTATALEMPASPSFLVLDAAGHVAARHADFSPAGPASLSVPGFTFTPVKPGEIVLLYVVGLGQTSPPISDQLQGLGSLPTLPTVLIGGLPATVQAAGISGPGLYQFNVVVPAGAQDGDLLLSATYNGFSTETGVQLTVQH